MYPGRVSIGQQKDEEEIMDLCRQLHLENGLFEMNEDKVRGMLRKAFNREGGILGVIGESGKIEGMIYLLLSSFWYSDEPHWEELLVFIQPKYRKSRNAVELIKFAKWAADTSGIPLLIGVISNERTAGKVRLYQRQFSQPIGNFFFYGKSNSAIANVAGAC